ncbi:MAG: class I SAM-dependent methyltransferase [Cyclobacteriaceae bacterium]
MKLQPIRSYLSHWLNQVDEHSIHSPFFFDFYKNVIKKSRKAPGNSKIEELRNSLLSNNDEVNLEDLGAGSRIPTNDKKSIAAIARNSISPEAISKLYQHIIAYNDSKYIVELGTSMGLNTLYLAEKNDARVVTFEGSKSLANIALTHFELFESKNIRLIEGNIDNTLTEFLQNPEKINFALLDANHRYAPTLRYFNLLVRRFNDKSILVVDDIHWSEEMEKAWKELYQHELVYGSIDLFRCGILFFDPAINKQHFVLSL